VVVLFAIYVLTPAFYYIPNAALSAIIIHAVADLFSGPKVWKQVCPNSPSLFLPSFLPLLTVTKMRTIKRKRKQTAVVNSFVTKLNIP
jgi:MFS superfamily sulfate permease-like transporter